MEKRVASTPAIKTREICKEAEKEQSEREEESLGWGVSESKEGT